MRLGSELRLADSSRARQRREPLRRAHRARSACCAGSIATCRAVRSHRGAVLRPSSPKRRRRAGALRRRRDDVRHPSHRTTSTATRSRLGVAPRAAPRAARHPRQRALETRHADRPGAGRRIRRAATTTSATRSTTSRVQEPHEQLVVERAARIEVQPLPAPLELGAERAVGRRRARRSRPTVAEALLEAYEFAFESPYVRDRRRVRDYARTSFAPGRPDARRGDGPDHADLRRVRVRAGVADVSTPVQRRVRDAQAASARTSRISRSPACARSGWRRAT